MKTNDFIYCSLFLYCFLFCYCYLFCYCSLFFAITPFLYFPDFIKNKSLKIQGISFKDSKECSISCRYDSKCSFWTWEDKSKKCTLMKMFTSAEESSKVVSGSKFCTSKCLFDLTNKENKLVFHLSEEKYCILSITIYYKLIECFNFRMSGGI